MSLVAALLLVTQVDYGTICQAIKNQWEIRMVVREDTVVSSKEIRFETQHVTLKPYEVGRASDGIVILKGKVRGTGDLKEFELNAIDKLEILTGTHFEAPHYKEFGEELENVCSLPTKGEVHILK